MAAPPEAGQSAGSDAPGILRAAVVCERSVSASSYAYAEIRPRIRQGEYPPPGHPMGEWRSVEEHRALFEAVKAHDADLAEALARQHRQNTRTLWVTADQEQHGEI